MKSNKSSTTYSMTADQYDMLTGGVRHDSLKPEEPTLIYPFGKVTRLVSLSEQNEAKRKGIGSK
jgi:hypothetical protein